VSSQLPLVLLPGLACDGEVWKDPVAHFTDIATVHIPDYGASDSIADMASLVLEHAPERFALAGHSMGGRIALQVIRRAPQRVLGLALLDTGYEARLPGEAGERERARREIYANLARSQGMRAMAREWLNEIVHPCRLSDAPLVDSIIEMAARKRAEVFAAQIHALLSRPDATSVLPTIRCPTLVLCGREDGLSASERQRQMAAMIPESKFVVIEKCGHMAPMEHPEETTSAMLEWFEKVALAAPEPAAESGRATHTGAKART
jgi:pimeloyl-ACP methyl ester carboxylesterase